MTFGLTQMLAHKEVVNQVECASHGDATDAQCGKDIGKVDK